ncbi:MAG TPA: hypothetical protein VMX76_03025 [Nevskiaceae bacterium]|nr:hypothetical protein [Nevskiaceae bacterium]
MSVEHFRPSEQLIGKSVVEVVSLLPTFPWYIKVGGRHIEAARIASLVVVDYDTQEPKVNDDIFGSIPVTPGVPISIKELKPRLTPPWPGRTTGLASLVHLDLSQWQQDRQFIYLGKPLAHIPLIDIDLEIPYLSREELLALIKNEVKDKTEADRGLILASGKQNFHFIGTERLFTDEQLVTFLSLCLLMEGPRGEPLVDSRWAGHSLTLMRHRADLGGWSVYDFKDRFATLRISTSERKPNLPKVVAVL